MTNDELVQHKKDVEEKNKKANSQPKPIKGDSNGDTTTNHSK